MTCEFSCLHMLRKDRRAAVCTPLRFLIYRHFTSLSSPLTSLLFYLVFFFLLYRGVEFTSRVFLDVVFCAGLAVFPRLGVWIRSPFFFFFLGLFSLCVCDRFSASSGLASKRCLVTIWKAKLRRRSAMRTHIFFLEDPTCRRAS